MENFFLEYRNYFIAAFIVIGSFGAGWIIEKLLLLLVMRITRKHKWDGENPVVKALRHVILLAFVLVGIHVSVILLDFPAVVKELSEKILVVVMIMLASIFCARVLSGILASYFQRHESAMFPASLITNITKIIVLTTGLIIVLAYLNISILPLITTLGVGGIAVALALQPTLSNLFSGFQLLLSKQLSSGDYVRLASGEEGYVEDISWRHTVIRTIQGNIITIPNSKLADTIFTNYHKPVKNLSVLVEVGVSYASDLAKVESATVTVAREVMKDVPGGVPEHEPFIRFHTFGDFAIIFTVILRAQSYVDQYIVKHEFVKRLHVKYREEGIEIPFPIRTIISKTDK
jgi:small-conductance mechanosensitive channel